MHFIFLSAQEHYQCRLNTPCWNEINVPIYYIIVGICIIRATGGDEEGDVKYFILSIRHYCNSAQYIV